MTSSNSSYGGGTLSLRTSSTTNTKRGDRGLVGGVV